MLGLPSASIRCYIYIYIIDDKNGKRLFKLVIYQFFSLFCDGYDGFNTFNLAKETYLNELMGLSYP